MLSADNLHRALMGIQHNGKTVWVCAKPINEPLLSRIKDAWKVITGRCAAVYFTGQE